MTATIYDDTPCTLGEGPLWHPERGQLFWFDIWEKRMHTREDGETKTWQFDEQVSAAGWVDRDTLLIASETRLFRFDTVTGGEDDICPLEAGDPRTRSNDGRADPWGGFWIGTMANKEDEPIGAIYRYYKGELQTLYPDIQIPNAICFAPDRSAAYWTDTLTRKIMRQPLDDDGWPKGSADVFVDTGADEINPDGAVTDADGNVWCAFWGSAAVRAYSPEGNHLRTVEVPGRQSSCPAFGGPDLMTLLCTSARKGLTDAQLSNTPENGMTFAVEDVAEGVPEPKVIL